MHLSMPVGSIFAASLLALTPSVAAQSSSAATTLQSCLQAAGVRSIINTDSTWSAETQEFQKRLTPNPASIAFPEDREQIADALSCARNASVKATALGAAHSFVGYGFGTPGNLVINMAAFNSVSYDHATTHLTFGGGTHIGPASKYLWNTAGRHFPHARGAHVGLVGSTIGGGFGTTSRHLGLAMDNIVSIEYMLYNGTVVTAATGSDLLWAGLGAGSSFGVVLSMATKTYQPEYPTAVNFTLTIGNASVDQAAQALIAVQDYSLSSACPDEFALRWSLTGPPWNQAGYFYGNPADFDNVVAPLLASLNKIANATIQKTELSFWDMEIQIAGAGMDQPDGGSLGGRSFYTQSLTIQTNKPLTADLAKTLFLSTSLDFNRTDLKRSGFLDLWGGTSRHIKDTDTSYIHGNNLWLIRWEANAVSTWPSDGISYLKNEMLHFEAALTAAGLPLRGYANYRDEDLTEAQWSSRLYGQNYARLKKIKAAIDPTNLFTNNAQAISA